MVFYGGFFRRHRCEIEIIHKFVSATIVLAAGIVTYYWSYGEMEFRGQSDVYLVLVVVSSVLIFNWMDLHRSWRGTSVVYELRAVSVAWLVSAASAWLLYLFLNPSSDEIESKNWVLGWCLLGWVSLLALRLSLRAVLSIARKRGFNSRKVIFVQLSPVAGHAAKRLDEAYWTGFRVVGYVDDRNTPREIASHQLPRLGKIAELADCVQKHDIDQVWIGVSSSEACASRAMAILKALRDYPVTIRTILDPFVLGCTSLSMGEVAGVPVVNLDGSPVHEGVNRWVKEIEDKLLAGLICFLFSPLLIAIAIGVKASSPGPVFYRQERVSWNGKPFTMLKFRSMPVNAEKHTGAVWASSSENRATQFGRVLRRSSLDELPQLINVLRGEMSIVGPRPERRVFVEKFKDEIPQYMKKHMVKAGITGWAQVNGWRGDTDLTKRIECDLYYIHNWSLWFDIYIVMRTFLSGFFHKNAY